MRSRMFDGFLRPHAQTATAALMPLRPYQAEACDAAMAAMARGSRAGLIVIATGGGKTVIFGTLAKRVLPGRTLILAHRDRLLEQARDKIEAITGIRAGLEKGRRRASADDTIVVASIQSLMRGRRIAGPPFALCVIDECHRAGAASYRAVIKRLNPGFVLGVTATPLRTDSVDLLEIFEECIYKKSLLELIEEGYLADVRLKTIPIPIDLSRVGLRNDDYEKEDLGKALEPSLAALAKLIAKDFRDRKLIAFCPLVETSRQWTDALRAEGLAAAHVDGECPDQTNILDDFKSDKVRFLSNASLLIEGYDEPSIDTVLILRPTKSIGMFSQMVGRGTRLFPGKRHMLLLDPLFQTEKNNPVGIGDLVGETEAEATAIENIMRGTKTSLSTAKKVREQASQTLGLIKAMEATSLREGYEAGIGELAMWQTDAGLVQRSGLPAAFKAFASDIAALFRAERP